MIRQEPITLALKLLPSQTAPYLFISLRPIDNLEIPLSVSCNFDYEVYIWSARLHQEKYLLPNACLLLFFPLVPRRTLLSPYRANGLLSNGVRHDLSHTFL